MKFRIFVGEAGKEGWWEEYEKNVEDPNECAGDMVDRFNRTLRPSEKPRVLLKVEVLDKDSRRDHEWEKQNLVTVKKDGRFYDVYKCKICGITGKRVQLGGEVIRDRKYKANVYARCDTAEKHLKKKEEKQ